MASNKVVRETKITGDRDRDRDREREREKWPIS